MEPASGPHLAHLRDVCPAHTGDDCPTPDSYARASGMEILTKVETRGSESFRHTHPDVPDRPLPACGAGHAFRGHARAARSGGDERQEALWALQEAQPWQVQAQAERHRLLGRDVSGRAMPPVNGSVARTVADLSDGGMLAQEPLRRRLRLPRYWRRHQTLPEPRQHLFGYWRLPGEPLCGRLHLRQSRGAPLRLCLDGGVSPGQGEVHPRQWLLRIRLHLRRHRRRRPVCLKSANGVTALARTHMQRPPRSLPGGRLFAGNEDR
jgi:hypothetical protein